MGDGIKTKGINIAQWWKNQTTTVIDLFRYTEI
jgi:hypothetical protein